jgi:glycogen debranching enzyme
MSASPKGLVNQEWKDSGNAIVDATGNLAKPPISLVEVQGYVYEAKMGLAKLFERDGESERATKLRQEAQALRSRFNRDFWMDDQGTYSLGLDGNGEPLKVVSFNAGHALWAGIADPDKARRTAERLMIENMFTGRGIRTLSSQEKSYNPMGYHLGTVWPHDNALIAVGFRRYGFDEFARRIIMGNLEAATTFEGYRLPELFAGFSRDENDTPISYPVSCHPQVWAAGSIPYLMSVCLALEPAASEGKLRIRRPILPDFVNTMWVRQLRVGSAKVDLHYERKSNRGVRVSVDNVEGKLRLINL